ncbi:hypothetical protein [Singulisphaera sp. PoT]|uniref:hypothetical protein n=1 Tax=Singulisphaera sp. PoT TaxID=3411797 RepID=UPI003BF55F46
MARVPRLTIGLMMAIVSLLAINFGIVRAFWNSSGPILGLAVVTLPMIDLLILSAPRLGRSNPTRFFWIGFHAVGWIMVAIYALLSAACMETFFGPVIPLERILPGDGATKVALLISIVIVCYTTPVLLVASLAGRFLAKYRIIIERR